VTKEKLVEVLGKINDGEEAGCFHDEIETIIGVLSNSVSQADVDKAYAELRDGEGNE